MQLHDKVQSACERTSHARLNAPSSYHATFLTSISSTRLMARAHGRLLTTLPHASWVLYLWKLKKRFGQYSNLPKKKERPPNIYKGVGRCCFWEEKYSAGWQKLTCGCEEAQEHEHNNAKSGRYICKIPILFPALSGVCKMRRKERNTVQTKPASKMAVERNTKKNNNKRTQRFWNMCQMERAEPKR